jgi:methane/ammonia monooxygenase subunit B
LINQKLIVLGLSVVLVAGTLGVDWADSLFQSAEAHGVQAQLQSRFIKIEDETFNRQSLQTGEILTLQGQLVSLVERDLRGWISIFSESTNAGNRWEIMARDPPGNVFDISGNSVTPYSISAKALEEGVYHVHTQLNVASVGPGLGPGQTVVVEGEPIIKPIPYTNIAYQSILIGVGYVITFATRPWQVI